MARHLEHWVAVFAALLLSCLAPGVGSAQSITTDGRLGAKVTLSGPNYPITADLGRQVGGNLFHSFGIFGLNKGESATFSGPNTVTNVIGRVTGGTASSINGKIDSSSLAGANLYLINPSGIVFGPSATVNVAGSFHATTADYLRLSDGAKFQATTPSGSTLSAAAPAAFGFLTAAPPAITVDGSQLRVTAPGATLGVVGGPITIKNAATLSAPAGTIHVTGVAGIGEVPVDPTAGPAFTVTRFGPVSITSGSTLDVSDPAALGTGGSVFIRSGALTISASEINGDNYGTGSGGTLSLYADSQIVLTGSTNIHALAQSSGAGAAISLTTAPGGGVAADNSAVTVGSRGAGAGGKLSVVAGQLSLTGGAALASNTAATGAGGAVTIAADTVTLDGGVALDGSTGIFANASGSAAGGSIAITAGQLTLQNGAAILAQNSGSGAGGGVAVSLSGSATVTSGASLGTTASGTGNAGNVAVSVAGPLTIDMTLGTDTSVLNGIGSMTTGAGNGGNVLVDVGGALSITGPGPTTQFDAEIQAGALVGSTGNAGNITVSAGSLSITRSGQLISPTYASGRSGDVSVIVQGTATIDGTSQSDQFNTKIGAGPLLNNGRGGSITVTAGTLNLINGGVIAHGNLSAERPGDISITVDGQLTIDGGGIFAGTATDGAAASANINIVAGSLRLTNGGSIFAATTGSGDAGSVTLKAGTVSLSNGGHIITAAEPGATGNAGSVTVTADTLSLTTSGAIISSTSGPGKGGDVTATVAGALTIDGAFGNMHANSGIQAGALPGSTGNAGNVTINAGTLLIANDGLIFSPTFGAGHGGDVSATVSGALTIEAISATPGSLSGGGVVTLGGGIVTAALSGSTGDAGNVTITAETLSILGNSGIGSGTYGAGNGGNVTVNVAGQVTIDGAGVAVSLAPGSPPLTGISADALTTELPPGSIPPLGGIITAAWPGSTGSAGNIILSAGALSIADGGLIFSPTFGPGKGGDVSASVAGALTIDGNSGSSPASLQTGTVLAPTGNAGNITIIADTLSITDNGVISSHALTANGGDIAISVVDLLYLRQGEITTQVDASTGNGGNISILGGAVVLDRSRIIASALGSGLNGNIDIRANPFIVSAGSTITATGLITFANPPTNLSGALVVLSGELRGAAEVLRNSCAARGALPRSTLTEAGRGGLPLDPEATIPALYVAGRDAEPSSPTAPAVPALYTRQSSLRLTMHCGD